MSVVPRFVFPWALVLLLLVPWSIWVGARIRSLSRARKWVAILLRSAILVCLIAALAGAELVRKSDRLAVFFLLDQSSSIPDEQRLASTQWVRNICERHMDAEGRGRSHSLRGRGKHGTERRADHGTGRR